MKTNLHIRGLLREQFALVMDVDPETIEVLGDRVTSDGDVHGVAVTNDHHYLVITLEATCAQTWGVVTDEAKALAWLEARVSSEPRLDSIQDIQALLTAVRRLCDGVEYKVPGKHDTWDAYHEGRFDFADQIEQTLNQIGLPQAATHDQITAALNRAADEVLEIPEYDDERLTDAVNLAVNLVVNAGLHFLSHPDASLGDAIRANYDNDFADDLLQSLR